MNPSGHSGTSRAHAQANTQAPAHTGTLADTRITTPTDTRTGPQIDPPTATPGASTPDTDAPSNKLPATRAAIAALIPHQGGMCLLDRVLSWDAQRIVAATATHHDPANPLRGPSGLRSVHLCEYGAQAAALHGGLVAQTTGGRAPPGMIVSLRDVELTRAFLHDLPEELIVTATLLLAGDSGTQYSFETTHEGTQIATGRVAIMRR